MEKKPDFEKLAEERYVIDETYTKKGADIQHDKRLAYFQGCHRIWTDYVTPLQSQLSEAEKRIKELEGKNDALFEKANEQINSSFNRQMELIDRLENSQSQNERLLSALKETLDYVYGADPELHEKAKQLINEIEKQ